MDQVPFFQHDLGEEEIAYIREVFKGNILTTGDFVREFEHGFASYLGSNHAVGLTSCTAALHLSLIAYGIGPGDEVITTPMSFIATATAIMQAGAMPVFVDVEEATGNIDAELIEQAITPKTKAILPVHLFGQMCDMRRIREIANKHDLVIIEDSAHCIEGQRDGVRPGELGDTACFSFYATKNMTCGEGGAVLTNSLEVAEKIALMRTHGMDKTANDREKHGYTHWDMPIFGWKYNMDNIQAAILLPQLKRVDRNLKNRTARALKYRDLLADTIAVSLLNAPSNTLSSHHLFPVRVRSEIRDDTVKHLLTHGIGVSVNYRPIHQFSYFKNHHHFAGLKFPVAEKIGSEILSLPLYPTMKMEMVDRVCTTLINWLTTLPQFNKSRFQ